MNYKSLFTGLFFGALIAIFVVHAVTFYKIKKVVITDHSYTVQMWNALSAASKQAAPAAK